ncbi:hypothetical protein J8TS2_42410 [Lederbergia ruris]|uniref:Uncharacterized protein n=1 Tax=Lederbergia ruris TaxID=217495 RepID=A0ABQ4KPQ5_9BACI|nr:hypothetical protein [Lederbergia ruris]GIN59922.1 hypothetical protein J8TS2_42410 [Lederbergia ruris]
MSKKTDIIKRQSPDIWQWAGTTISSIICSETLIDDFIETQKQKIENTGMELLDIHVFKWEDSVYRMATIEFLMRPKHGEFSQSAYFI